MGSKNFAEAPVLDAPTTNTEIDPLQEAFDGLKNELNNEGPTEEDHNERTLGNVEDEDENEPHVTEFKVGGVVQLNSGGPELTISKVGEDNVTVLYFDHDLTLRTVSVPKVCLTDEVNSWY
jgi:hypothetical protein